MTVGILVVSHSARIAEGVIELARQMAADVPFAAAGGTDDGGIGTSFDAVSAAEQSLSACDAIVVLCDLGSAYLTVDTVLDFMEDEQRARMHVSHAPLVEGTVAAAVAAQGGAAVDGVLAAAATAFEAHEDDQGAGQPADTTSPVASDGAAPRRTAEVVLRNETGLHARPAAELVKLLSGFDANVRVNGVDGRSLLALMSLALPKGASVSLEATGADAEAALSAVVELVNSGFGE